MSAETHETTGNVVRVADVMERDFVLLDGLVTVTEALAALRERNAAFLIVAKRHDDDEFGIVGVTDIAKQVLSRNRQAGR